PVACYTQQGVPAPPSVTSAIRAGIAPSRFLMLRRSALCLLLALAFAFVAFPSNAPAQKLKDGQVSFYGSAEYRGSQKLRTALSNATEDYNPKEKSHKEAVAFMASDYVYPIYWDGVETLKSPPMNKHVEPSTAGLGRFSRDKDNIRQKTTPLQQALCREVIDRCKEVSAASPKPIVGLNAAILLSRISERQRERTALQGEKE